MKTLKSPKPLFQLIAAGHDADTVAKWVAARVSRLIVVDFDGTITERDTLDEMCRIYAPDEWAAAESDLQQRTMTLREVIAAEFAPIKGDHDTIVSETVDRAEIRAGFADFVRAAEEAGDRIVIVSSGFESVIRPVLEREGLGPPRGGRP